MLTATGATGHGADAACTARRVQTAVVRTALARPVDVALIVSVVAAVVALAFEVVRVIAKMPLRLLRIELFCLAIAVVIVRTVTDLLFLALLLILVVVVIVVIVAVVMTMVVSVVVIVIVVMIMVVVLFGRREIQRPTP